MKLAGTLALSAGTLMASAGTPYRLVPAQFYPWTDIIDRGRKTENKDYLANASEHVSNWCGNVVVESDMPHVYYVDNGVLYKMTVNQSMVQLVAAAAAVTGLRLFHSVSSAHVYNKHLESLL